MRVDTGGHCLNKKMLSQAIMMKIYASDLR